MDAETKPATLVISFTYTQQTKKIVDVMADVLREPRHRHDRGRHRAHRPPLRREFPAIPHAEAVSRSARNGPGGAATQARPDRHSRRHHRTGIRSGMPRGPDLVAVHRDIPIRSFWPFRDRTLAITRTNPAFLGRFFRAADDGGGPGNRQGGKRRPT